MQRCDSPAPPPSFPGRERTPFSRHSLFFIFFHFVLDEIRHYGIVRCVISGKTSRRAAERENGIQRRNARRHGGRREASAATRPRWTVNARGLPPYSPIRNSPKQAPNRAQSCLIVLFFNLSAPTPVPSDPPGSRMVHSRERADFPKPARGAPYPRSPATTVPTITNGSS